MDIAKIDKNFAVGEYKDDGDTRYYTIPCEPFDLYGVFYEKENERFVRMPSDIADKLNENIAYLNKHTSGGRIRFSTDSKSIAVIVKYSSLWEGNNMPLICSSGFILLEETDGGYKHVKTFVPQHTCFGKENHVGFSQSCNGLSGEMKNYILFFPLYNDVESLTVGLDKDAAVSHGKRYKNVKPVLYYGSSITQGACASRPDNSYQAIISKRNNIDYINLGFSGNAKAEPVMCDYLAGIDCSVFVCDYDHNAPNKEYLQETHYSLYKDFRAKQPETPIIFVSKPDIEHDLDVQKRFEIIKATYDKARESGDKNVYLIDGRTFFEGEDRNACTVDGCHPNDLGFFRMANVIYGKLEEIFGKKHDLF